MQKNAAMRRYKAFEPEIKVNKRTVLSVIKALPVGEDMRNELLRKNNIRINTDEEWYNQQDWLNCFSDIHDLWGEGILFLIGRAIVGSAKFPEVSGLKDSLEKLDIAYHMNHAKNGKVMFDENTGAMLEGIGHYRLTEFDENNKKAVMVCDNPYPSMFDLGIIDELVRKFSFQEYSFPRVYLDLTKESRRDGGASCTYIIEWD